MHAIAPSCLLPLPDLRSPQIAHQCLVAQQQSLDTLTAERQELDEHLSNIEPPTLVVFFNTRYLTLEQPLSLSIAWRAPALSPRKCSFGL